MKLWDKGSSTEQKIHNFTVGNDRIYDVILIRYDIQASIVHAKMLAKVGLLSSEESNSLVNELSHLLKIAEKGELTIEDTFEDMHSKIEYMLTQSLGDVGKKIHMARSRNDQVLVALQLYFKNEIQQIKKDVSTLFDTLLTLSDKHKDVFLPGYTHLQIAMPSSFGLWFSAYAECLVDDVYFLNIAQKIANQNPLGSAAGYGSSFAIDREFTTKELGFETMKYNVISAQMSRGKVEKSLAIGLGFTAATLAKMSMDICLYMSQNFNFISFPETLVTGSSIMPHKKNPDVFELIRAKCNVLQILPQQITSLTTNLTSGYHRDLQLCKEIIMPAIETIKNCLEIFNFSITQIEVNTSISGDDKYDDIFSVEVLNQMIIEDKIPFREAYKKVGNQINQGKYKPLKNIKHTHKGSKDNLCLKEIRKKMEQALDL